MYKRIAMAILCAGLVSCAAGESDQLDLNGKYPAHVSDVVVVSELLAGSQTGRIELDLQSAASGYWIDQGVDYSAVDFVCPTGRLMNLESWLAEIRLPLADRADGFSMYSSGRIDDPAAKSAPVCSPSEPGQECYLHREPDGSWVCFC